MKSEKLLQLKQQRASLTVAIRTLIDRFTDVEIPAESKTELEKVEKAFDDLNVKILAEEAQLNRERLAGERHDEAKEDAKGDPEKTEELKIREAFGGYLRQADSASITQYRALQQDNPTQAGYLVAPEQFVAEVIQDLNDLVFMRQNARKFTLKKAQSLGFPKRTARMSTFAWGTEIQAPTADSSLAFGKREFIPKPATGGILVSKTLVRNSAINIEQYIRGEFANDFAQGMEQAYMTGSGAGQPLGVFTASADGISTSRDVSTGNTATEIKFDGLIEAKYSIKQQHATKLRWLFHRDGVKKIVKLKDSNGQYIWQPSVVLGQPDLLLNLPVDMSENAPSTFTTGLYVGMLGNFSNYWIADSLNMEVQALMELYALTNQVYYISRIETDGMPVLEEAFARVKLG